MNKNTNKECKCGCKQIVKPGNNFIFGHSLKLPEFHHNGSIKGKRTDVAKRNSWMNTIIKPNYKDGRSYYQRYKKNYCEKCKTFTKKLAVHHKDKNRNNSNPENLETLCYTCHNNHHYQTIYAKKFKI